MAAADPDTPRETSGGRARAGAWFALTCAVALLGAGLLWTAWFADDAFITFRCMDNFVHGRGLVWNVGERVQAFTNPLWLLLLAGPYALTGNLYAVALGAGFLVTAAAVALLVRSASSVAVGALGVLFLCGSKAFVEYSTSGLENPLLHVAVLLAVGAYLAPGDAARRTGRVAWASSLAFLTRPDAFLFTGLLCLAAWLERPTLRALGRAALGWTPILAWELFSLAYYGFWLPNTAVAKLGGDLPPGEVYEQGLRYLQNSLAWDPLTLVTIAGAVLAFGPRLAGARRREALVALALVVQLAYVVRVGGDFMSGRFLTAPFVVAVALLVRLRPSRRALAAAAVVAVALGTVMERSPWRARPGPLGFMTATNPHGITDEREVYYAFTAPMGGGYGSWGRLADGDAYPPAELVRQRLDEGETVQVHTQVGMLGHYAGPGVHIVDKMGLADPLLARLPLTTPDGESLFGRAPTPAGRFWRIGHLERELPDGYRESLVDGANRIAHPALARLYGAVRSATREPVWSRGRWRTLWDLQRGRFDDDVEAWRRAWTERMRAPAEDG